MIACTFAFRAGGSESGLWQAAAVCGVCSFRAGVCVFVSKEPVNRVFPYRSQVCVLLDSARA